MADLGSRAPYRKTPGSIRAARERGNDMAKLSKKGYSKSSAFKNKIATVMHEAKKGNLYSSSGQKVTKKSQMIAIALSEARRHAAGGKMVKRAWGGSTRLRPALKKTWSSQRGGKTITSKRRVKMTAGSKRAASARKKA